MPDLPKEIADMCGIVLDPVSTKTQSQTNDTLLKITQGPDGVYEVTYNDHKVGWIQPVKSDGEKKYQAMSVHGRISYHWTFESAHNFLMENFY